MPDHVRLIRPGVVLHVVHDPSEAPGYYIRANDGEVGEHARIAGERYPATLSASLTAPGR